MNPALAVIALVPGLALGSFLNVVAARLPRKRSLAAPRSACLACGTQIGWRDNLPLISYVFLRGRCRTCATPIGLRYPAVELATALLLAACVGVFGLSPRGALAAFFCVVLVALSAIDLEHRILPDRLTLPSTVIVLGAQTAIDPSVEWTLA
ncbi:MAG: prepilin peptidase, partial [Thermoleophilia bacterium]|nr:prepilin peptidase [Thermoleophilia bacterium]